MIYDGQPRAVKYDVTINGEPVEDADVTVTYSWGDDTFDVPVDAGYYTATVTATKDNYETATGSATVTIRQREITVTADSASKTYDGTPLTKDTVTARNLVNGHVASATVTGSQTKIGASQNVAADAVIKDANEKNVTDNYKISYQDGTLTVTGAEGVTLTKTPKRTNVTVGGTITWTVTVTNNGSATAKNLTLTDSIQGVTITGPSGVDNKNFDLEAGKSITFIVHLYSHPARAAMQTM